ncbi:MAG TPA: Uma2 family endonuclease, partial [Pyrinomonadaceae bacterium]|nr:Uma2 family endonuclease [Pyrinomonadaceae bacterium]
MSAILEQTRTGLMTADELLMMQNSRWGYELVRGKLKKYMPAGNLHGIIALKIGRIVGNFVEENNLGVVVAAETGFLISHNPDTVRAPDSAFIGKEKLAKYGITEKFFPDAPDLAVEVVSPNDRKKDIEDKVQDYLAAGVNLIWIIYPQKQFVAVHRQSKIVSILFETDELEGEEVLPDFRL